MTTLMFVSIIVITICVCFQAERGIFDFISYSRLFRQLKQKNSNNRLQEKMELFILIPVLREQKIIEETILNFGKIEHPSFEIKIAMVTSVREQTGKELEDKMTTEDIIVQSLDSGRLSALKNRVLVLQDPSLNGNMATQLNYAIDKISQIASPNTFYLVYNADSIISTITFDRLSELLERHAGEEFAFQQPCAFVKDMHPFSKQFTNAMSLYQSWYCLGHESRLLRNYDRRSEKWWGKKNGKLGVVVGHGSGMTFNINRFNGGYPSDLLTEDLTFGFILSIKNVPILLLPALEIADVPTHFSIFIKQKSVWFWNFLGYSSCYRKMRIRGYPQLKLFALLVQGVGAGAYWFFDTFFILTPFFLSVILKSYFGIVTAIISFVAFYIVPQYFLFKKLPSVLENQGFTNISENIRKVSFAKLLPTLCLIIITNSVGAWIATCKSFNYFLTGKLPTKYKTGD